MLECITKDTVLTILASHYAKAKKDDQKDLINIIMSEVREAKAVRHVGERNADMDKTLEECGFE